MSEIDEILELAKKHLMTFPLFVAILSRSNEAINSVGDNAIDHIIDYSPPIHNAEELEIWLTENKNKKNILLIPAEQKKQIELRKKQQESAKKTNEILEKKNPNHYRNAAKKRWAKNKNQD